MTVVPMIVSLICFYGDGNPLTDLCISAWEADTVIECAALGDATVPLHVNTGDRNPGPGQVSFHATVYDGARVVGSDLLFSTPFEWRGSQQEPGFFVASYGVPQDDDLMFRADFDEACACHTRAPRRDDACEKALFSR